MSERVPSVTEVSGVPLHAGAVQIGTHTAQLVTGLMVVGGVAVALFGEAFGFGAAAFVGLGVAASGCALFAAFRVAERRTRLEIQSLLAATEPEHLGRLFAAAPKKGFLTFPGKFYDRGFVLQALVAAGHVGRVFRVGRSEGASAIDPIPVPCEAQPLDESDPGFASVASAYSGSEGAGPRKKDDPRPGRSALGRRVALLGGRYTIGRWFLIGGCLVYMCMMIFGSNLPGSSIAWLVTLLVGALVLATGGAFTWRRQWLLVPGGVVVRTTGFGWGHWRVRLYSRVRSVLYVGRISAVQWTIAVADGTRVETVRVTGAEATLLLRAWLSPLSPPPLERLTDLG